MSSLTVNLKDRRPIYEQLIDQIVYLVLHGIMQPGEQLPSVRSLSLQLSVNPNTIQKAYVLLEEEGLMASHAGAKSYMTLTDGRAAAVREELLRNDARTVIDSLRQMGLSKNEALSLIEAYWE